MIGCITLNIHVFFHFYSGAVLDDTHVFKLSTRITTESELMNLGIKGLKLPKFIIESALYRHPKDIQDAAHDVLSEWVKQQEDMENNYKNLVQCLKQCQMNQLAVELMQLVEGTCNSELTTKQSK